MNIAKPPTTTWAAPTPTDCAAPVKIAAVEEVLELPPLGARVVDGSVVVVGDEEEVDEDEVEVVLLVVLLEEEVVVTTAELVVVVVVTTAEVVGAVEVVAGTVTGRMMLRETVAPHSAREDPLGQHPPSVQ